jgi:tetratricopeptide (TPR) repeat protein
MKREFATMEAGLQAFIEQPDQPTLILDMADCDSAFPFGVLKNWDRQWPSHIFLLFPFDCPDSAAYLQRCVDSLAMQIRAGNEFLVEDEQAPWPPLPLACSDPAGQPAARLQAAIEHIRRCVPAHACIVWGFAPASIGDPNGYLELIIRLLALEDVEPWMEGQRFIVRDDRAAPFLLPRFADAQAHHTCVLSIDFSVAKAADGLARSVNDPALPVAERMQALTQLAAFDLAHGRLDQASQKYALLHAYHHQQDDSIGQALALGGAGDVATRQGNHALARQRYQQALAQAADGNDLSVTLNLLMAAGGSCLRVGRCGEAQSYLELAERCAGKLMFLNAKLDALEQLGEAQRGAGKLTEAARTWVTAKDLALQFGCLEPCRSILDRLIALCANAGLREQVRGFTAEKTALDDGTPKTAPVESVQ